MTVYCVTSVIFKGDMMAIVTLDDSMLVPDDANPLLNAFFIMYDFRHTMLKHNLKVNLKPKVTPDGVLLLNDESLVQDVFDSFIMDLFLYKGYIFVLLSVNHRDFSFLTVIDNKTFKNIGYISSRFGSRSSAELSQLIMTTPELNWNI